MEYSKHTNIDIMTGEEREQIIRDVFGEELSPMFVEIGAYEGVYQDPNYEIIRDIKPKCLLVEPIPQMIPHLRQNYKHIPNSNLIIEQSAISTTNGKTKLYISRSPTCTSLIKNTNFNKRLRRCTKEIDVKTLTWDTLLQKHNTTNVTMVHIDAEGIDSKIVRMILESDFKPKIIEYEDNTLTDTKTSNKTIELLKNNGYEPFHLNYDWASWDVIAIQKELSDS